MFSDSLSPEVCERLAHAVAIAREAGKFTLQFFRREGVEVDRKDDGSPVTAADRGAEELLRRRISERFPADGILGEEFGDTPGTSDFRWVLDPIDGTKSFIHGVPLFTTLVAVLRGQSHDAEPLLGVIYAPATGEMVYAARGGGCWSASDGASPTVARVSDTQRMADGLFLFTEMDFFAKGRPRDATDVCLALQKKSGLVRAWGDAYGYLLVATGRAEAMVDPQLNLWDAAALQPIIEEAGGHFVDWQGNATIYTGDGIGTNGRVTDEVLAVTRGR
jgi:histidinol phosphatase-like enzyme (inositol monophosphatase family)